MWTFTFTSLFLALAISSNNAGDVFQVITNGSGTIAIKDLASRLSSSGKVPKGIHVEDAIATFDKNDDARFDETEFDEMLEYISSHLSEVNLFESLDSNGDGQLSRLEFLVDYVAMNTALGVENDQEEIDSYFNTFDLNRDGTIQLEEFCGFSYDRLPQSYMLVGMGSAVLTGFALV